MEIPFEKLDREACLPNLIDAHWKRIIKAYLVLVELAHMNPIEFYGMKPLEIKEYLLQNNLLTPIKPNFDLIYKYSSREVFVMPWTGETIWFIINTGNSKLEYHYAICRVGLKKWTAIDVMMTLPAVIGQKIPLHVTELKKEIA